MNLNTRRRFLQFGAGAMAARVLKAAPTSVDKAYLFLDSMMDKYAQGSTLRLVRSYVPTKALNLHDTVFTYDNDVMIIALLQRGSANDLTRAGVLGDSLVYGQAHDPIGDGRIRNSYHANPYIAANGSVNIIDGGSDCGNMAWTGLALAQLYHKTGTPSYLNAALAIGNWVQNNAFDTRGNGGYTGGETAAQAKILYKATEHNIDLYGLFTMLAALSSDATWSARAQYALTFVHSMWASATGHFWTGTGTDGVTTNKGFIPEDVQSWSYLATLDPTYATSIDWAYAHLAASQGGFSGVSFSNKDKTGVWFEGTAHMAAALEARNASGDSGKAGAYLATIQLAQTQALNANGRGIVAASKNGLKTGDGDAYYASLHIGATSWYALAALGGNPLRL